MKNYEKLPIYQFLKMFCHYNYSTYFLFSFTIYFLKKIIENFNISTNNLLMWKGYNIGKDPPKHQHRGNHIPKG